MTAQKTAARETSFLENVHQIFSLNGTINIFAILKDKTLKFGLITWPTS